MSGADCSANVRDNFSSVLVYLPLWWFILLSASFLRGELAEKLLHIHIAGKTHPPKVYSIVLIQYSIT